MAEREKREGSATMDLIGSLIPYAICALASAIATAWLIEVGRGRRGDLQEFSRLFTKTSGFSEAEDAEAFRKVRKYWDERPCNSGWKFPGIEFGSKEVKERSSVAGIDLDRLIALGRSDEEEEYHIPVFAEFDKWKGKRVLEIGGGICTTATSFAKAGAKITVVELSPKSMELCQKRFKILGLEDRATFYVANAESLSSVVPVETYDLVWSFGVIHHSPNPERIIDQIKQYMGKESKLKLMVYSKISFKLFWVLNHTRQWSFAKMDEVVAHYSEAREGSPVTYTYSYRGLAKLLQDFDVLYMGKAHIFPYQIEPYKSGKYVVDPLWQGVSKGRWEELEEELGWHLLAEARMSEGGERKEIIFESSVSSRFEGLRGVLPKE
ncbi:hypothetical protein GUITHDRAFT_115158 [Guillardia theta CCMP2712]|uniref:Methyltransferase type 11 domain-containing protein n=1 Tax=Guillardia theta (strain CCMP2712) TaxID=905079 RepID=L1ISN4_GUITC|nr:hypothetical protein GUITHDRAFT_115158 [Guillardia theta CCMP2712]EKX38830.1 hypothetical protein GUITHDRAFT_115158 [Guillardia theta CCMP2712]|eukprot:XP_005825810.1 hypothetical protein GUITHDRAFT_115158 [Guillardia theta CCMP2712]